MANKQSKYLHFKVYHKFCLKTKYIRANFKTNTIQHNKKETMSIKETVGLQFSKFIVVIKVI
jgi:hypothetical protein